VTAQPELREKLGQAALRIARAVNYSNAGTLEFLTTQQGDFYFLEMNTRLQVEHPVTEWATGVDLVRWQIRIAAGERLTLKQEDVRWMGSAIECRVYAEDPDDNFCPSPGRISQYVEPGGPGVRVDGGVYAGWTVPLEYDPLLAKLCVWGETREVAIERMRRALAEYRVLGITTNLRMFAQLMRDEAWKAGDLDTGLLDDFQKRRGALAPEADARVAAILAAAYAAPQQGAGGEANGNGKAWRAEGRRGLLR
jgi:acetyl-CoA carboxylase biotin carboxylase subunit